MHATCLIFGQDASVGNPNDQAALRLGAMLLVNWAFAAAQQSRLGKVGHKTRTETAPHAAFAGR